MTSPVFVVPLRFEAFAVRRGLRRDLDRSARRAAVELVGMGPARAIAAQARLERTWAPDQPVVLTGFAGALVPELRAGDVVVATGVRAASDGSSIELPASSEIAALLRKAGCSVHEGTVVSSAAVVSGSEARALLAETGALAVDMESVWCAPLVRTHPFAVVRVVVDGPGREIRSLSVVPAGVRAMRSLATVARVLQHWSPARLDSSSSSTSPLLEVGDL